MRYTQDHDGEIAVIFSVAHVARTIKDVIDSAGISGHEGAWRAARMIAARIARALPREQRAAFYARTPLANPCESRTAKALRLAHEAIAAAAERAKRRAQCAGGRHDFGGRRTCAHCGYNRDTGRGW